MSPCSRACPLPSESGQAPESSIGACSYRRTGTHFAGTCANDSRGGLSRPRTRPMRWSLAHGPEFLYGPRGGGDLHVRITGIVIGLVALGLMLSGCDRCGDWYSPFEN